MGVRGHLMHNASTQKKLQQELLFSLFLSIFFLFSYFLHGMLVKCLFSVCVCACVDQNVCDSVRPLYRAD